ncbi:SRPBCC family protein [Granulosicoccaceae sp. 1_MG-2023]|nr:SRPBCC family protein [Granulosicoccaceae sp. 1_MG-2023]
MSKVSTEQELNVSAEKVWELIGNFNALPQWHPAVEKSELSEGGTIRTLSLVGGGQIIEKLEKIRDGVFEYSYSIVDSPLPVSDYTSTLRIRQGDDDNSCVVEWGGRFNPAAGTSVSEAEKAVMGIYQAGFDNLKKIFGMP